MQADEQRFTYLVAQYLNKTASAEEFKELFSLISTEQYKDLMLRLMKEEGRRSTVLADVHAIDWDKMYNEMVAPVKPVRRKLFGFSQFAAAAMICIAGAGLYFMGQKERIQDAVQEVVVSKDLAPGGDKAILELADGTKIELNESSSGMLTRQGNTTVRKEHDGLLVYQTGTEPKEDKVVYNTLRTPRGGKYMLVLPDNSKAWLNSASSITFPNKFSGTDRRVRIKGEVYFEVVKSRGQRFSVSTEKAEVEVLGTHFNVMSYPDEVNEEVTLLEGSVRLKAGNSNKLLKPGQLAVYSTAGQIDIRNLEFPDAKIDWKNGYFQFENESIEQIMRKVSRWYDVDVVYAGRRIDKHFTGTVPRNNNVSRILNLLKKSGNIKFEIDDKTITVKE